MPPIDLSKINPNDYTLTGALFVVTMILLWFLIFKVWPFYSDKYLPTKLEQDKLKIQHEYEIKKENNSILRSVDQTLAKMTIQLDNLTDMVVKHISIKEAEK